MTSTHYRASGGISEWDKLGAADEGPFTSGWSLTGRMGKPCLGCCDEGPADRHQAIVDQGEGNPLPLRPHARDSCVGDPPAAMNLRPKARVEQGYRIGHPHQYQGAPPGGMDAKIVILRFERDYVAAHPRRQPA
jgi:hypothetical protein